MSWVEYEAVIKIDAGEIKVNVSFPSCVLNGNENEESTVLFAAEAEVQSQLNYAKLISLKKLHEGKSE